jgi:hypothetical protein
MEMLNHFLSLRFPVSTLKYRFAVRFDDDLMSLIKLCKAFVQNAVALIWA